ncbi:uncharacterized protein [Leptinotarsa decemlineata]|uniref:uncharacterized protein n=1 Tax=Leptinotarsa decemlineata TaxID=7539 RepID=UPI003D307A70
MAHKNIPIRFIVIAFLLLLLQGCVADSAKLKNALKNSSGTGNKTSNDNDDENIFKEEASKYLPQCSSSRSENYGDSNDGNEDNYKHTNGNNNKNKKGYYTSFAYGTEDNQKDEKNPYSHDYARNNNRNSYGNLKGNDDDNNNNNNSYSNYDNNNNGRKCNRGSHNTHGGAGNNGKVITTTNMNIFLLVITVVMDISRDTIQTGRSKILNRQGEKLHPTFMVPTETTRMDNQIVTIMTTTTVLVRTEKQQVTRTGKEQDEGVITTENMIISAPVNAYLDTWNC